MISNHLNVSLPNDFKLNDFKLNDLKKCLGSFERFSITIIMISKPPCCFHFLVHILVEPSRPASRVNKLLILNFNIIRSKLDFFLNNKLKVIWGVFRFFF